MPAAVQQLRVGGGAVDFLPVAGAVAAERELAGQEPVGVQPEARIEGDHLIQLRAEGAGRGQHAERRLPTQLALQAKCCDRGPFSAQRIGGGELPVGRSIVG